MVAVGATCVSDVQAAIRFASAHALPVAVVATGHGAFVSADGAVLINVRRMDAVTVDAAARTATVGAAVEMQSLIHAAAEEGLAPLAGSSPNVGVVGFVLGGGLSPMLGRLHGYAGGTFRNYTTSGAELIGGAIAPSIEQQIEIANADDPNSTIVVMDGGGNDILIPAIAFDPYDCKTQWYEFGRLSSSCKSYIDDIYGWNTVDDNNNVNDTLGHGTNVMGMIGAYGGNETGMSGVCWRSRVTITASSPMRERMKSPGLGIWLSWPTNSQERWNTCSISWS